MSASADYGIVGLLGLLGAYIWLRELRPARVLIDTLPILAGLPLFIWLGRPWRFAAKASKLPCRVVVAAVILAPAGTLLDSTLLLTASWTLLLWAWLSARLSPPSRPGWSKLLVLPFCSFPWVVTDWDRLGWWFRLSGAGAAEKLLGWAHLDVARQGTYLSVNGFWLSVEPACSGLSGLQAMLIAGAALAWLKLGQSRAYWWNMPLLPVAAWTANLWRILAAALLAVWWPASLTQQWFAPAHELAGWLALCLMFALCWGLFEAERWLTHRSRPNASTLAETNTLRGVAPPPSHPALGRSASWPWLEGAIIGYCTWRSLPLLGSWFHSPFDRLGWGAFVLWLVPIVAAHCGPGPRSFTPSRLWWLSGGLALTFLGDLGDLNTARQTGLACSLMSLLPEPWSWLWAGGALAWLPAGGWVASRLGLGPDGAAAGRTGIALTVALWTLWLRWRQTRASVPHPGLESLQAA